MKLLRRRDAAPSRRHAKLWMKKLRRTAIGAVAAASVIGIGIYAVVSGSASSVFSSAVQSTGNAMLRASASAGFTINEILVVGRHNTAQGELLAKLDVKQGAPIFSVSIGQAQQRIAEIPWISDVSVARRLPDKIVVSLSERTPVALWQNNKRISLIDGNGVVLADSGLADYGDLPLVVGENAGQAVTELLHLLQAEPSVAGQMASAVRIGGRRWDLHMKNGLIVKLPEKDVGLALRRFVSAQQKQSLPAAGIDAVDLRQPDRLVVRLKQGAAETADAKTAQNG